MEFNEYLWDIVFYICTGAVGGFVSAYFTLNRKVVELSENYIETKESLKRAFKEIEGKPSREEVSEIFSKLSYLEATSKNIEANLKRLADVVQLSVFQNEHKGARK